MVLRPPSETTLNEIPKRSLVLLSGIARDYAIAQRFYLNGYSPEEHERGWQLLKAAAGYAPLSVPMIDVSAAKAAYAEIDRWDEPNIRVFKAAFYRLHRDQYEFVFADIKPVRGPGSLLVVETFLDRVEKLRSSTERAETREADLAAVATLEARGLTADERDRLRGLIATAKTLPNMPEVDEAAIAAREETRKAALYDLYLWFNDWSTTARTIFSRRGQLITLGLARRRSATVEVEEVEETPA